MNIHNHIQTKGARQLSLNFLLISYKSEKQIAFVIHHFLL